MIIDAPCKDCKNRKIGCHSQCEKYQEYDEQRRLIRYERAREYETLSIKDRQYYAELKRKGRMKQ